MLFIESKFDFRSFTLASSATEFTEKLACPANLLYSLVARKETQTTVRLNHWGNLSTIACFYLIATERLPIANNIQSVEVIPI